MDETFSDIEITEAHNETCDFCFDTICGKVFMARTTKFELPSIICKDCAEKLYKFMRVNGELVRIITAKVIYDPTKPERH